jgi:hypothetical protein
MNESSYTSTLHKYSWRGALSRIGTTLHLWSLYAKKAYDRKSRQCNDFAGVLCQTSIRPKQ